MWHRLIATLLLASMASSSGSECPENCLCSRITSRESQINGNETSEIHCKNTTPTMGSLTLNKIGRFILEDVKPYEIQNMLLELETQRFNNKTNSDSLVEFAIVNCSLTHLNVTSRRVGDELTSLNLTNNKFNEIEALRIDDESSNRLERLDLSDNELSRVKSNAFVKFSRLLQLTLRRNKIVVVEKEGFAGLGILESLDLSENHLSTLVEDAFVPLYFLQKLDLSGNEIKALDGRWFNGLGRLRELDVSRNGLARSQVSTMKKEKQFASKLEENANETGTLESLPFGLTVLRLADNPLMELELSLVLGSGRRLETVDASRIGLDRVPPALTRSVRDLTLAGNKLTTIRGGDFDSYPLLRLLDLSNNSLRVVEEDALGRLEVLEKLDLSGNKLTELPQSLPSSLVHLVIRYNSIDKLTAKDLQGLSKLEKLCIDNNAINEIEEGSMSQLNLLTELDVSDNPLKQLPANTFGGPRSLVILKMSGLASLEWEREKRADMAFPVPAPERLVSLDLSRSPALAAQLLADEAALSACKSLRKLNLAGNNLTTLRSDLAYLLPQLHILGLSDNEWNCTKDNTDVYWLADWIKQHEEIQPSARCAKSSSIIDDQRDIMLAELTSYRISTETSLPRETMEIFTVPHDSEPNKKQPKEDTNLERVIIGSVEKYSDSYTREANGITTVGSSFGIEENEEIESSTKSIPSGESFDERNEDYDDALPEIPTLRSAINIFGEMKGSLINFGDDNNIPTEKIGAQELIGSEDTSKSDFIVRAHPGMLVVFAGAALGLLAILSVVLSRRLASTFAERNVVLSRQEQQPIITELW